QIRYAHIRSRASSLKGCLDHIDGVISVSCKLVRHLIVSFLVSSYKALNLLILRGSYERSQIHQILCQSSVKVLYCKNSIHAVAAKVDRLISLAVALCQHQRSLCIVERHKQELSAC